MVLLVVTVAMFVSNMVFVEVLDVVLVNVGFGIPVGVRVAVFVTDETK